MKTNALSPHIANFDQKTLFVTTVGVLVLHSLIGIGLTKMTTLDIKKPKVTPPLQISFSQLPKSVTPSTVEKPIEPLPSVDKPIKKEPVKEIIKKEVVQVTPQPKPVVKSIPEPVIQPKAKPSVQPHPSTEPVFKKTHVEPAKAHEPFINKEPVVQTKIDTPQSSQQLDNKAILAEQAHQAQLIAQQKAQADALAEKNRQAEIARQQAEAQAERDRQIQKEAQAKAEQQRQADLAKQKALADKERAEKVRAEQEQADKQKAEQERAEKIKQQAQNSQPVSFSAGEARWKSAPNSNLPSALKQIAQAENISSVGVNFKVDVSGRITAVAITRSSGNAQIDNFVRQRIQSARLYPFTRNGNPVAGSVSLNISF